MIVVGEWLLVDVLVDVVFVDCDGLWVGEVDVLY